MPKGEYLAYGGLAVIEGVMMRSPKHYALACRAPNGDIVIHLEPMSQTWIGKQKWLKLPFLRGSFALLDAMTLGNKVMKMAAQVQVDPQYQAEEALAKSEAASFEGSRGEASGLTSLRHGDETQDHGLTGFAKAERGDDDREPMPLGDAHLVNDPDLKPMGKPTDSVSNMMILVAVVAGLAIGFGLFNALPNIIAEYFKQADPRLTSLLAETIKLVFFIGYLWLISLMKEIREIFRYHGAEHKAINALEMEQPLNIETCQAQTRLHPRCGTSFAVIVFMVGFLLFPLVPRYPMTGGAPGPSRILDVVVRLLIELAFLPIIAGISYELLRMAGKLRDQRWVNIMFRPGLWTQLITTKEPDTKHVEVALAALKAVVDADEKLAAQPAPIS